jgi:hypothetical protein
LYDLLAKVSGHAGPGKQIGVVGTYALGMDGDIPIERWRVYELDLETVDIGHNVTGGSACMRSTAAAVGLLAACEDYLYAFFVEPVRPPGWESDIDAKQEAADRLEDIWKGGK